MPGMRKPVKVVNSVVFTVLQKEWFFPGFF